MISGSMCLTAERGNLICFDVHASDNVRRLINITRQPTGCVPSAMLFAENLGRNRDAIRLYP